MKSGEGRAGEPRVDDQCIEMFDASQICFGEGSVLR
jgi:hypothetical protein